MSVRIKWGTQKFNVSFNNNNFNNISLRDLINECSLVTNVPFDNIKLLHSGEEQQQQEEDSSWFSNISNKFLSFISDEQEHNNIRPAKRKKHSSTNWVVMTDLKAPLIAYGIKQNSVVMMLGDNNTKPSTPSSSSSSSNFSLPQEKQPKLSSAEKALKSLNEITQNIQQEKKIEIDKLSQNITLYKYGESKIGVDSKVLNWKNLEKSYLFLNESLMQDLLKCDNYVLDSDEDPENLVRTNRKETVKLIQGLLTRMDKLKEKLDSCGERS